MARDLKLSDAAANAQADALASLLNGGNLKLYSGQKPADANSPVVAVSHRLLATLRFGTPAFRSADSGVIEANALTPEPEAPATGEATWYRCYSADGKAVMDGTIGPTNSDMNMKANNIQKNMKVELTVFKHNVNQVEG